MRELRSPENSCGMPVRRISRVCPWTCPDKKFRATDKANQCAAVDNALSVQHRLYAERFDCDDFASAFKADLSRLGIAATRIRTRLYQKPCVQCRGPGRCGAVRKRYRVEGPPVGCGRRAPERGDRPDRRRFVRSAPRSNHVPGQKNVVPRP